MTVDWASLVLTYDRDLNETLIPAPADFTVGTTGSAQSVEAVAVSGPTVTLTLDPGVDVGDLVTLDYLPGINPLRDVDGDAADPLTLEPITNITIDVFPPALVDTAVFGSSLLLTYGEPLDETSVPAAGDFTVASTGAAQSVDAVAVNGNLVLLTLSPGVAVTDAVTVNYTPSASPLQDLAANPAVALVAESVANNVPMLVYSLSNDRLNPMALAGATLTGVVYIFLAGADAADQVSFWLDGSPYSTENFVPWDMGSGSDTAAAPIDALVTFGVGAHTVDAYVDGPLEATADFDVTLPDTTAPVLTSASVDGATLVLTYDEALDGTSTPATAAFNLGTDGIAQSVTVVDVAGSTVTLTLSPGVGIGDTITVDYGPGAAPVQDVAGNDGAALSTEPVTNTTADIAAPTLNSASADGATLVLIYDEALDETSTPGTAAFNVGTDGATQSVTVVDVSGSTVTLTLSPGVGVGDTITVDYTPGGTPVQDFAGNNAAALSIEPVTNATADTMAPVLTSANVDGTSLVLTFNEALDEASTPDTTRFSVGTDGAAQSVTVVVVSGSTVTLTLSPGVGVGDAISVDYSPGSAPVQDIVGNDAAALSTEPVTNATADTAAPVLTTATVDGANLVLTYDEALVEASSNGSS